jgi:apolipoprotein N-acyltransferase
VGHWCSGRGRPAPPGAHRATLHAWSSGLIFASAWALGEWLRGLIFTGFPWLASGYTQVDGLLAGYAPIVGVYGVGWMLAWCATLLVDTLAPEHAQLPAAAAAPGPALARRAASLACFALALALGGIAQHHAWTHAERAPLSVRLLQGNVGQSMKFEQSGVDHSVALYQQLITAAPADLIVTPETAIPLLIQQLPPDFGNAIRAFADRTDSYLLFGALGARLDENDRPYDITNSLFGVDPHTRLVYRYDKNHLVPFGEFVPTGFHWFVQLMNIPLGDASRGAPVQEPFAVRGERIAPDICYEDIFGEEIARTLRNQADPAGILVNSTNLGWFGNTVALEQHLQMARMRAQETGRPLLSASNNGITAAIDAHGTVTGRLAPFTVDSLHATVQGMAGLTPYISWGNQPICAISLVVLLIGAARRRLGGRGRRAA